MLTNRHASRLAVTSRTRLFDKIVG